MKKWEERILKRYNYGLPETLEQSERSIF